MNISHLKIMITIIIKAPNVLKSGVRINIFKIFCFNWIFNVQLVNYLVQGFSINFFQG